jgi:Zn-dependent protease
MLLQLLQTSPLTFAIVAVVLLYSLALHELGHALVADRMGDPTARNLGRVTLNPVKHLDPVGTLLLLIVGFGWAKPVPIRPGNFRNYRVGMFWVSIAGILINLTLAVLALLVLAALGTNLSNLQSIFPNADGGGDPLRFGLFIAAQINVVLAVFNLLPVPPLDGSKILQAFLPSSMQRVVWQLERYGFFIVILILVLFREQVFGLINWVTVGLMRLILGAA